MTQTEAIETLYFTKILNLPIYIENTNIKIGKMTDLVFKLSETYPEAVGIYVEHGWNRPTEFILWNKVVRTANDAIFVKSPEDGNKGYPSFSDQPGWILMNEHLMGKTILDLDGRRVEVVNDVQLLKSKERMIIVAVDTSLNGFLRKWHLGWLSLGKDRLIPWKYVQPLSVEDVGTKGTVVLSITRKQLADLPGEDLADALEELSGKEQQAVFSTLDSEKAAETLVEAEPRTQRQLMAHIRREKAGAILSEMSVPQLAILFSVLPHQQVTELMALLPPQDAERIKTLLSEHETTAVGLMSQDYLAVLPQTTVAEVLKNLRTSEHEYWHVSYIYVVTPENVLQGVVDLRELILARNETLMGNIMTSPVVVAEKGSLKEELIELFQKYHFRMIPVVDDKDHLLGVIFYQDVMPGAAVRPR